KAGNREDRSGAVFTVSLPRRALVRSDIVAAGTPVAEVTVRLPLDRTLAGIRVMVVDDEEDARDILAAALEESGAEVVPVASADAALESLPVVRPHVLLSDIEMPAKDGYALMEA